MSRHSHGRGERGHAGHNGRDGRDGKDGPEGPPGPKGESGESSILVLSVAPGYVSDIRGEAGIIIPRSGKLKNLFVYSAEPFLIKSSIIILVNQKETDLAVIIEKEERRGSDKKHSIRVNEGDLIGISSLRPELLVSVLLE